MSETQNNQPIATKQFDRVQAAIWRQTQNEGGAARPEFSISFSRSYKDADGKWQRTHSLSIRDLPHLKLAVDWALHELLLKDD